MVMNMDKVEGDEDIGVLRKLVSGVGDGVMIVCWDGEFRELDKYGGVKEWGGMEKKYVKRKWGDGVMDWVRKVVKGEKKDKV